MTAETIQQKKFITMQPNGLEMVRILLSHETGQLQQRSEHSQINIVYETLSKTDYYRCILQLQPLWLINWN